MPMTQISDTPKRRIIRHLPLLIVFSVAVIGAFTLRDYLSFDTLRDNRESLLAYRDQNFWGLAALFIGTYIVIVAFSLPGAAVASVTGGFLFGLVAGTVFNLSLIHISEPTRPY